MNNGGRYPQLFRGNRSLRDRFGQRARQSSGGGPSMARGLANLSALEQLNRNQVAAAQSKKRQKRMQGCCTQQELFCVSVNVN